MSTPNPVEHPYIYTPSNRAPGATRTVHRFLTLLAWMLYAYLWLPVLTLIAWVLGVRTAFVELYVRNNRLDNEIFIVIGVVAVVATSLLVGWAEYNRRKFSGRDRRTAPRHVDVHDVAESMFAPMDLSHRIARAKSMTLSMDEHARPIGIARDAPLAGPL